jgi:hypothetical protein
MQDWTVFTFLFGTTKYEHVHIHTELHHNNYLHLLKVA